MDSDFELFMSLESGFAPTPAEVGQRMMEVARLKSHETFYDLGSGDGTLLIIAAREFGAHAVGIEIQKKLVADSLNRIRSLGLQNMIEVVGGDYFKADIRNADVLTLYLVPNALERLKAKLKKELKRGTRIVGYKYPIEGWIPRETHVVDDIAEAGRIFLYEM